MPSIHSLINNSLLAYSFRIRYASGVFISLYNIKNYLLLFTSTWRLLQRTGSLGRGIFRKPLGRPRPCYKVSGIVCSQGFSSSRSSIQYGLTIVIRKLVGLYSILIIQVSLLVVISLYSPYYPSFLRQTRTSNQRGKLSIAFVFRLLYIISASRTCLSIQSRRTSFVAARIASALQVIDREGRSQFVNRG